MSDVVRKETQMGTAEHRLNPFMEKLMDGARVEWKPLGEIGELTTIPPKEVYGGQE